MIVDNLVRGTYVGGSDITAICGLSSFRTPTDVWESLTGKELSNPFQESIISRVGLALEPIIVDEYRKKNPYRMPAEEFLKFNVEAKSDSHPFFGGHLDALYTDLVIETKTLNHKKAMEFFHTKTIPHEYLVQLAWYCMLANTSKALLLTYCNGELSDFDYEADKELQDHLVNTALDFWDNHVVKDIPPAPANKQEQQRYYRSVVSRPIEANIDIVQKICLLKEVKDNIKQLDTRKNTLEFEIQNYMGNNETLVLQDDILATWKMQSRKAYEVKASESRVLRIK